MVLTAEDGKLWLTAKGARSVRSKVAPICRAFTYANLEFYERGEGKWLSGGSINADFSGICRDLEDFSLASYIGSLANEITGENTPAEDVLRMTLNTLYAIEHKLCSREQIKAVYELFAAAVSGMTPNICQCSVCRRETFGEGETVWLDVMNGCFICGECKKQRDGNLMPPELDRFETKNILLPLDTSALDAMRYVFGAPLERIFSFSLTQPHSLSLFCRAAETYLLNHLERDFDTLHFYKTMTADGTQR